MDSTATHYFYNIYKAWMQYIKPYIWHYKQRMFLDIKHFCQYINTHTTGKSLISVQLAMKILEILALFIWGLTASPPLLEIKGRLTSLPPTKEFKKSLNDLVM